MRKILIGAVLALCFLMISLTLVGKQLPRPSSNATATAAKAPPPDESLVLAAAVTVARVAPADFVETVLATGSLVAREEILVGPEVEGLRITEVLADEGMRVKKGDVLARLVADTLDAQLAQNDAALARATATIAQARSTIVQAEARLVESSNAFERAKPLRDAGHMAESAYDSREQAARTAQAQLVAARDGLTAAEAEKAQIEAQRRELTWRRGRTEVVAPADGIISRRMARIGGYAAGAAEPMFRIVAKGEVELDAEVTETRMAALTIGQPARVEVHGSRHDRRHRPPRVARGRQGHAPRPGAHLPRRQRGPEGRRLRPRQHRDRQRPRAGGPRLRHPLRTRRSIRAGRARQSRGDAPDQDRAGGGRAGRGARGPERGRSWSWRAPAPSCATATPCDR